MLSYYDLITAQDRADRIQSAGYRISPAARHEVTQDAIARHLNQQHQAAKEEREVSRRTALATFANTIRAIFRSRTVPAR